MTAQQPIGFYVVIKGIEAPIRPRVDFWNQPKFDVRRYAQDPSNRAIELDDSRDVTKIAYTLEKARRNRYVSLARNQPLVKAGKVTIEEMQTILDDFCFEVWSYRILGELVDYAPHLRGFDLHKGKDTILYRGLWKVKEDNSIDFSAIDPKKDLVFLKSPGEDDDVLSKEWIDATGASVDTFPWFNVDFSKQYQGGLNVIGWEFGDIQPTLYGDLEPDSEDPMIGALLGSKLDINEIVERFVKNDAYELERQFGEERNRKQSELRDEVKKRFGRLIIKL